MWLLDANMDVHLAPLLATLGIDCDTAASRGWKALSNGQLVAAAQSAGFRCLLTRDRLFGQSASRALQSHPEFALVLVSIPQRPWQQYRESFLTAWSRAPIRPQPGRMIEWPVAPLRT